MPNTVYLAYGSNLHPLRLSSRVASARFLDVVEMPGYQLAFHKRSIDGSAKCLVYSGQDSSRVVYGALYEFESHEKQVLDKFEGVGNGYIEQPLQLTLNKETLNSYAYFAQATHIEPALVPYDWYKALVLAGARHHGLPAEYVASIEATPSIPDPDIERAQANAKLLRQMGQR